MKKNQRQRFDVAIVGGGPGSKAVMELIMADAFTQLQMNIVGMASRNPGAPGTVYAKSLGIHVTNDYKEFYGLGNLDLIIELTGDNEVLEDILKIKPPQVKVMDHVSARLFWDFMQIEERYRELYEHAPDMCHTLDANQYILRANQTQANMLGYAKHELIGKHMSELLSESSAKALEETFSRLIKDGKVENEDLQFIRKDGTVLEASYSSTMVYDEAGNPLKTWCISRDISEKKKMERKLKEYMENLERQVGKRTQELYDAHAYTRGLIESSLDALVTFDKDGIVTDVNKETVRLTGCSREELIGSRFRDYFTDPERAAEGVRRSFEEGKVTDYELVMKSKTGEETPVSYNATVYRGEEGQVKGVFAAARDMTEIGRLQHQLVMAEKHAGIGRLAAGVAHEIKNQLAPTLIEAQRVTEPIENNKRPSYEFILERARAIEEATRCANRITMALLDYARETKPELVPYNLKDSIDGVLSLHESKCRSANIQLKLETVDVSEMCADKRQIEQVLINIIDNAYEAIISKGKGGVIAISVKNEGHYTVISIRDTGIGISKKDETGIFDPFFTSRFPRGIGLGLSVSYGIVEKHGGRIDFESEPGKGSTFRVCLPILPIS
jgi:PAS domain S-box-containing protein